LSAAVIDQAFPGTGIRFDPAATWPNVSERFREVGKEVSYRTEYAALCSQTHDAAEDLINQFIIRGGASHLLPMLELETKSFSRMLVHSSVGYFLEACKNYAEAYGIKEAIPVAERAAAESKRSAGEAIQEFQRFRAQAR